jgi:hypothetical protein
MNKLTHAMILFNLAIGPTLMVAAAIKGNPSLVIADLLILITAVAVTISAAYHKE